MKNVAILIQVEATSFIDTHEHLPDESTRLAFKPIDGRRDWDQIIENKIDDWSFLFTHYVCDDMASAGIHADWMARFWSESAPAEVKFDWIAPYWRHVRHTGFGQAIRHTLKLLYGEDDLTRSSAPRIAERYTDLRRPGLYNHVLREVARIDHCHVNSTTNSVFHVTERPDLLRQDLDFTRLANPVEFPRMALETGVQPTTLDVWLNQIDEMFRVHGPSASAVKLKTAYARGLHFSAFDQARAESAFRHLGTIAFGPDDQRDIHDFLIRYVVRRASESGLAIKFHTGYHSSHDWMPLSRVRSNQGDLCRLYEDFPDARFVIFHIGYPYHHEVVAIAKHYHNVFVDMCWAWLLDPAESIQFLRSFITAVPHNKLFAFGGDYFVVEPVAGHAHLARLGITRSIVSLIEDGLIAVEEAPPLIDAIMRGNALATFGHAPVS